MKKCNLLKGLSEEKKKLFRKIVIANILSTDMTYHFTLLEKCEDKIMSKKNLEEDLETLSNLLMHGSDFFGTSKNIEISFDWSDLVNKEFINQVFKYCKTKKY